MKEKLKDQQWPRKLRHEYEELLDISFSAFEEKIFNIILIFGEETTHNITLVAGGPPENVISNLKSLESKGFIQSAITKGSYPGFKIRTY